MPAHDGRSWSWCISCERCYVTGSFRWVEQQQLCPYFDCRAEISEASRSWANVRQVNPHYPEIPQIQERYLLIQPILHAYSLGA
jgi:hypothetical protein